MRTKNTGGKKMFLFLAMVTLTSTLFSQQKTEFIVNGKITGKSEGLVYLYYNDKNNKRIKDSAQISNGSFSFKGTVAEPSMAFLSLREDNRSELNSTSFFLEPATISVQVEFNNFRNAAVTGSKTQQEYVALEKSKEGIRKELQPHIDAYTKANAAYSAAVKAKQSEAVLDSMKEAAAALRIPFEPFNARMDQVDYAFFEKHPSSYVTAYMMRFHVSELSLDSLQLFYNRFSPQLKQSNLGKEVEQEIAKLRSGSPGSMATDFAATDINGQPLRLSDFQGKYVLLDFWASWCVPCRKGNPHLKELYSKYRDRGLEIIGIADDDRAEDAWRKAVEKDGIGIWKHVRRGLKFVDGNYDRSVDISENYGIHTLPTKILIDPRGKIIGRYGEEEGPLDRQLASVFGG